MNDQISEYVGKYPDEITALFKTLAELIYESAPFAPEEKLWAKLPTFCCGEAFVRLIPFKDHINVEARAVLSHTGELPGFKITPKGMLQISAASRRSLPLDVLKAIFSETLAG